MENTAIHDRLATAAEKGGEHTANRPDEGILGEANLYVVVFNEGICSVRNMTSFLGYC